MINEKCKKCEHCKMGWGKMTIPEKEFANAVFGESTEYYDTFMCEFQEYMDKPCDQFKEYAGTRRFYHYPNQK